MTVNHLDYCLFFSVECFLSGSYTEIHVPNTLSHRILYRIPHWEKRFLCETLFEVTRWIIWVQKQAVLKEIHMCAAGGKRGILDGGYDWTIYAPGCVLNLWLGTA